MLRLFLCSLVLLASTQVRAMIATASLGKLPPAVSPLSMTASAPSSTALATSLHSALVGLGFDVIDSNICVATMTGMPCSLATLMMRFWAIGTSWAWQNDSSEPLHCGEHQRGIEQRYKPQGGAPHRDLHEQP